VKYKVFVSPTAKAELAELLKSIRTRFDKKSADRLKASFRVMINNLKTHPLQFPAVPERPDIRKCVLEYLTMVYYRVQEQEVTIHKVRDGRHGDPSL
jgi:plasmid stabilization system protein ParE